MRIFKYIFLIAIFSTCYANTFYVNGSSGSDNNSGDEAYPFATIQKAADVMLAGDVCKIRKGTYREKVTIKNSGKSGQALRFEAFANESVSITGLDKVGSTWVNHSGNIYKIHLPNVENITQVFVDENRMEIGRFPNNTSDDLLTPVWGMAESVVAEQKPAISEFVDPALAELDVDLQDGDLWLLTGLQWVSFSTTVEYHDGNTIGFVFPGDAKSYAYEPKAGSHYFVTGLLACLDAEKEWIFDESEQTLYFYAPGGVDPSTLNVQIRTRQVGLNASQKSYVEFSGIDFFAAEVDFTGSESSLLENSRIFYPVPFYAADSWATTERPQNSAYCGVRLGGQNNLVQNCEVAYSWGEGIVVFGDDNRVENCLVHDIDWLCTDAAPIHTNGFGHIITHNTINNAGRSGLVHRKSGALEIAYNHIYDCGLLTTDLGATYCWQTDGDGTVIHHNWVHDVVTEKHTAGIYLDNGSSNFIVHHNVVWNTDDLGIQTNLNAFNHEIYNNTIWNCSQAMGGGGGDEILENQIVYNNLSNAASWFGTDVQQNITIGDAKFVDAENGDFRLQSDSPARDDYIVSATFLNGGFESGTSAWTGAGCTLETVKDPVHSGTLAVHASNRNYYWEGVRQDITQVVKDNGPGNYKIEAWIKLASGEIKGYLRFKVVDDTGDNYPGTQKMCNANDWTKLSLTKSLTWTGDLQQVVFELMTTDNDNELVDLYIDDCYLETPDGAVNENPRGGIYVAGINDDVTDDKVDAGAYEYGGSNANWTAGSTLTPAIPNLPTSVKSRVINPLNFNLEQNYPNPFNAETAFNFSIKNPGYVKLMIFALTGQKISDVFEGSIKAGNHTVNFDASNLASGVYIYRLETKGQMMNRKMILIK